MFPRRDRPHAAVQAEARAVQAEARAARAETRRHNDDDDAPAAMDISPISVVEAASSVVPESDLEGDEEVALHLPTTAVTTVGLDPPTPSKTPSNART